MTEYEEVQVDESKSKLQSLLESQERHIERLESFISTLKEENERLRNQFLLSPPLLPINLPTTTTNSLNTGIRTSSQVRMELEEKLRQKAILKQEAEKKEKEEVKQ